MIDTAFVIIIPWGLIFGFVLALNLHRFVAIFTKQHENFNRRVSLTESIIMSCMFMPFLIFVAPQGDEQVSYSPMSDFIWERLIVMGLAIGLGFALSKWAKSQELI